MTGLLTVTVCTSADEERMSAVEEIVRGLTAEPKTLSPKFLYHEDGSGLFDEITRLEEYYPHPCRAFVARTLRRRDSSRRPAPRDCRAGAR